MPMLIENVSDDQAISEACTIASRYTGQDEVSASFTEFQGMASKTIHVKLANNTEWIVQLRDNEIDTTKTALARSKLGDIVPAMRKVHTDISLVAYISNFIPGRLYSLKDDYDEVSDGEHEDIARQIAALLPLLIINEKSEGVLKSYILPRLEHIITREFVNTKNQGLQDRITGLIENIKSGSVNRLPLSIIHEDINAMNIILNDSNGIKGFIDWEGASILPLGINLWAIRRIAFVNIQKTEHELPRSEQMAKAWWEGFRSSLPEDLRQADGVLDAIVTIMQVGAVLSTWWEGKEGLSGHEMAQLLEQLDWMEKTYRPMCSRATRA